MIFWLLIFLIILVASVLLAYSSMKNFPGIPDSKNQYGVFLVRSPNSLNSEILQLLKENNKNQTVSLERLFKGDRRALVIFGPRNTLNNFPELELLELEDYVNFSQEILAFEIGMKDGATFVASKLSDDEEIWYQIILGFSKENFFLVQTRMAVISQSPERRQSLSNDLFSLNKTFSKLVLPQNQSQIHEGFKKRILLPIRAQKFYSSTKEILSSLGILPPSQRLST